MKTTIRENINAWVHWQKLNPTSESSLDMANDLALLLEALEKLETENTALTQTIQQIEEAYPDDDLIHCLAHIPISKTSSAIIRILSCADHLSFEPTPDGKYYIIGCHAGDRLINALKAYRSERL